MQVPLQITLRGVESSPALENLIRERANRLEQVYDRITSCRVALETAAASHHGGPVFTARIDVKVPGSELVVNREHDSDAYTAVRHAFEAALRQLEDHARGQRAARHDPTL
jgi:ribosomal subunit interface protein